jgi:hypothetical protein
LLTVGSQDESYELIDKWLNPPKSQAIYQALDDAKELRDDGTAEWIFTDSEFEAWKSNDTVSVKYEYNTVLWVTGKPLCTNSRVVEITTWN